MANAVSEEDRHDIDGSLAGAEEAYRLVQEALHSLMRGRTVLVIAHRLSTVKNAHRILVLKEGEIIEEGKHDDLLRQGGLYQRLHEIQFSG